MVSCDTNVTNVYGIVTCVIFFDMMSHVLQWMSNVTMLFFSAFFFGGGGREILIFYQYFSWEDVMKNSGWLNFSLFQNPVQKKQNP